MSIKDEYAVIPDVDTSGDKDKPVPKLYAKLATTYNAMLEAAEEREEDGAVIWTGALTSFVDEKADVPQSQYSRVIGTLTDMQCIAQLRRGSGRVPSQWAMIGPPTLEAYYYQRRQAGYRREKRVDPRDQLIKDVQRELAIQTERINRVVVHMGIAETPEDFSAMFRAVDEAADARMIEDGED